MREKLAGRENEKEMVLGGKENTTKESLSGEQELSALNRIWQMPSQSECAPVTQRKSESFCGTEKRRNSDAKIRIKPPSFNQLPLPRPPRRPSDRLRPLRFPPSLHPAQSNLGRIHPPRALLRPPQKSPSRPTSPTCLLRYLSPLLIPSPYLPAPNGVML